MNINCLDAVKQFEQLLQPYPRAAAGLLEDLCGELAALDHRQSDAAEKDALIAAIRDCFRPLDAERPPSGYAWDTATHIFSRWLNGPSPFLRDAVRPITGWPEERIEQSKQNYRELARLLSEEWASCVKLLDEREAKDLDKS